MGPIDTQGGTGGGQQGGVIPPLHGETLELPPHSLRDAYALIVKLVEPLPAIDADTAAEDGIEYPREGLHHTPHRAAQAMLELTRGYREDAAELFTTFDADGYDEMVVETGIPFYSLCEHHLLPFHGEAHVGYIPNGRIVGLSKLARLVDIFARRLQVQERLTAEVADALTAGTGAKGTIVVIEAEHLCMTMRGVRKPGARTTTSAVRGALKEKPEARAEALALIHNRR